MSDFDVDPFLVDATILPFNCDKYCLITKDHGHVLSGDLRIVKNKKMEKVDL